jgi:hypothetical protein
MPSDARLYISDAQDITTNAGATTNGTNVIDLGTGKKFFPVSTAIVPNPAPGTNPMLVIGVTTALAGDGAVLTVTLWNHTAATSLASGHKVVERSFTLAAAGVSAGKYLLIIPLPKNIITKQYLGIVYGVATANLTAGNVDALIDITGEYNDAHEAAPLLA